MNHCIIATGVITPDLILFILPVPFVYLVSSMLAMNQIGLDVDRTFYTHRLLMNKHGQGQRQLFGLPTYS